jgi:hypothetical protein
MVDDFLIHAPTRSKCVTAFNEFMDMTVRLGFICQKVKTSPPAQVQKFCGFLYDTSGEPTLLIPAAKVSRAKATLAYLRTLGQQPLSRLALAVAVGLLQSLVDATPQRIGQTYLRRVYDELHALADRNRQLGRGLYYTTVTLSADAWDDFTWWATFLEVNPGARGRSATSGSLGATWGDGSGTGTGGTYEQAGTHGRLPVIEAWMGTWEFHVHVFSSNWRELRTLLYTLERILRDRGPIHATLFYFTDNLVAYYIVQSGSSGSTELHRLIRRIKEIEILLRVRLEVIHVPGTLMILQGTDGLSRGMWLAPERLRSSSLLESSQVLTGAPFSPALAEWALGLIDRRPWTPYEHIAALADWSFERIHDRMSIWTPGPELARQAITAFLDIWVETPLSQTGGLFLIPRVMQRDWFSLSKHVRVIGTYYPATQLPATCAYSSEIPLVVLYCQPYVRSLPLSPDRMEYDAAPYGDVRWHEQQADAVRGLC